MTHNPRAFAKDDPRLFMGAPCIRGHDGLRYRNSNSCVECSRIRNRKRGSGVTSNETKSYLRSITPERPGAPVADNGWPFGSCFATENTSQTVPGERYVQNLRKLPLRDLPQLLRREATMAEEWELAG